MRWGLGAGLAIFFASTHALAQDVPPPPPEPPPAPAPQEVLPPPAPPLQPEAPPPPPPSIVVDAKDDRGQDVKAVTVLVDDKPIAYELDPTKPIELTAGAHTVTLQRNDGTHLRMSEKVTLAEGQTALPVHFRFSGHAVEEAQRAIAIRPDPPVVPRVIVGLGLIAMVAGSIVVLARPSSPANCNATCTRESGQTDAQFAETQSREKTHDDVTHVATGMIAGGAAATVAGLLWYFIELPPVLYEAKISPWMTANSGGLSLRRGF